MALLIGAEPWAAAAGAHWTRFGWLSRKLLESGSVAVPVGGLILGLALLAGMVGLDLVLGANDALVGVFAIAPFVTAVFAGPRPTAVVACAAAAAGAASGLWNDNLGSDDWIARLAIIAAAGAIAVLAARATARARRAIFRLGLLDRVGRIADGSLPLAETLERVTDAVVPGYADLCMVDAINDGAVRRIGVQAAGAHAARIEAAIRRRTPSTPDWLLDPESESLDPHLVPSMPDEVLRAMADGPEDLEFLRELGPNSYIVAPLLSRGRSLGALTVVRIGDSPSLDVDEIEFVTALASRIGVALDNAGLFSDLESVERRMDSVMGNISEAVIVHDASGAVVYANDAAEELAVAGAMEALGPGGEQGAPRFEFYDEDGRPLDRELLPRRRTLRGEASEPQVLQAREVKTGQEAWLLERSTAIEGPAGQVLYSVTTVQDVTAVKGAEVSQRLLAETADAIAMAGDYESTLKALSAAVVPQLADWCSVSVPAEDGSIERVAEADSSPEMIELESLLREGFQVRPGMRLAMADVLRASQPVTAQLTDGPVQGWVLLKPIRTAGSAFGVLTLVNRAGRRAFSSDEIRLARAMADRAGVAILNAKLATERAAIAETLQRALLPPMLPEVTGWSMAAMYRPAGEVTRAGGDFYDVFEGADGWVVVLGDVEGHGADAAAFTAMVRYTVRTAGMIDGDLIKAFEIVNRQLRARDRPKLCSVLCITFGSAAEATVVSAGHPLPLLVRAGVPREVGLPGSLLGALDQPQWSPVRFAFDPGAELVAYTDGVVEARRNEDRFGRERLAKLLASAGSPADVVERVGEALDRFAETIQDDAALLVLRRDREGAAGEATDTQIRQEIA